MKFLELEANGIRLRFVSTSGESRAALEANTFQDTWSSSLTVAVMAAENLSMNGLIATINALLKSGFNGWIIAGAPPQSLTSFRILSEGEEGQIKEALLTVTIGFKVYMPKEFKGA